MKERIAAKFIQLFGKSPDICLSYLSIARAKMVYKYQRDAFMLGCEVGYKWGKESECGCNMIDMIGPYEIVCLNCGKTTWFSGKEKEQEEEDNGWTKEGYTPSFSDGTG